MTKCDVCILYTPCNNVGTALSYLVLISSGPWYTGVIKSWFHPLSFVVSEWDEQDAARALILQRICSAKNVNLQRCLKWKKKDPWTHSCSVPHLQPSTDYYFTKEKPCYIYIFEGPNPQQPPASVLRIERDVKRKNIERQGKLCSFFLLFLIFWTSSFTCFTASLLI